ncbi:MAG: ATP-binding protein [Muribaculaceae bacterium]|nr:ATP-binding protein [Muribaculaceae bacterium]
MEEKKVRYPIGQQDFKTLRERELLYIDKTVYVRKIVDDGGQYFFLARPRRFGKSLFLSTLRYFFEGRRDLFNGLYIDSTDWDWVAYPVLHLDLNTDRYADPGMLDGVLDRLFRGWEEKYEIEVKDENFSQRFSTIIESAHKKAGRPVVILVDEYDKPLVGNLNKDKNFDHYRSKLASIYSNFKSSAEHIRLVFLTGVSRFSMLSVFSDLNNLNDISFDDEFADICGITEKELLSNFREGIGTLAAKRRENYDETCNALKLNYDGYRFAAEGSDIYNPWSVLNCLQKSRIGAYWNATGAATVIADALRDANIDIEYTLNAKWDLADLAGLDLLNADPTALLYQTGYLTIGDYDFKSDSVRLKIPNEEVRKGFFNDLLNAYLRPKKGTVKSIIEGIMDGIKSGEPEKMMRNLDAYFAGIPYDLKLQNENNFHNVIYVLMTLIGIDAKAEVHTSDGRIDLLIETSNFIYVIELKYDGTPGEALCQICEKQYDRKFLTDDRKIFKIGVSFSSETRRIEGWEIYPSIY